MGFSLQDLCGHKADKAVTSERTQQGYDDVVPEFPGGLLKMAPQGRPIKRRHGAQDLPMKAKRQKRIHNLSAAIAKGRRY